MISLSYRSGPARCIGFCLALVIGATWAPRQLAGQAQAHSLAVEWHRLSSQILEACPGSATDDLDGLLRIESDQSYAVRRKTSEAGGWFALACTRARLFALEGIAREGLAMPSGWSWAEGAVATLVEGLKRSPDSDAAELLGILAQDEYPDRMRRLITESLGELADNGARGRFTLRACSDLRWRAGDRVGSISCSGWALEVGADSTWHLLNLARARFADADTANGQTRFFEAVAVIRDVEDRRALDWHLRWFLDPHELAEWDTLAGGRTDWVRNLLAERDLRDGRPGGARIAAHFERLGEIDTMFRVRRSLRELKRFEFVATPENRIGAGWVAKWTDQDPAGVPARPYRYFRRTHPQFDDRAEIWMRWGQPDERRRAFLTAHVDDKAASEGRRNNPCQDKEEGNPEFGFDRCLPAGDHSNAREGWLYRLGEHSILVNFEGEDLDGSGEATRLVAGVLGLYLCGLETTRCNLTHRSTTRGIPELSVETVTSLARSDETLIKYATTNDANTVQAQVPIDLAASASRVWISERDKIAMLIPYAVSARDIAKATGDRDSVTLRFTVRQWDHGTASFIESNHQRAVIMPSDPSRKQHVTGLMELASGRNAAAWSLEVMAQEGQGRAWGRGLPDLAGALVLSDLVVGQASQGVEWLAPSGAAVPLGPLGAFNRREPLSVFWQVNSVEEHEAALEISLERTDQSSPRGLHVSYGVTLNAGIGEFQRELDLTRLDAGSYRLRVTVATADGRLSTQRTAAVLLW